MTRACAVDLAECLVNVRLAIASGNSAAIDH